MKNLIRFTLVLLAFAASSALAQFDHSHKAWDDLLKKHVKYVQNGNASRVDYAGFAKDRAALKSVIDGYQKVTKAEFDGWSKAQQEAFLINDYNALTVEFILTKYPDLKSIRDLGSFVSKPWSKKFFTLFGQESYLDYIEHEVLRKDGAYNEPRVHVGVVCASIGCPMLRNEAFTAEKLDAQLEDAMKRFLSDRTRNRFNPDTKKLELSRIFDWYGKDFEKNYRGYSSVKATMARYADQLAEGPADRALVRDQKADVVFLDYDWALNDAK
jgi:hypothetical protein